MTSQELLDDIAAIRWPDGADDAAENRRAFVRRQGAEAEAHGPHRDPLLTSLADLVAVKKAADEQIRLLLAYGRVYVTPRPHTLESLGQAADLTPSGVSRAFGAKEVMTVGTLTDRRPAAVVADHNPDDIPGPESRRRCTWGGSRKNPCTEPPKYTVTDKSGTKWSCCDTHLPAYLRSRPTP
ncbi:hypothetical protein [Actinacidiphila bryophytorum]|uniref:Uncharacterized protein n=2 Tax=Actinacidiphila bryophytorum TaxID=1436133 RepID=A0A9W4E8N9_9ACTN|nr:hypothetical protein [Actinacidiphila bryophytorum]MBM9438047.1 hypothetical protein [Actinacidiphila bryophytorum]CAG7618248.1 conserved hypothetical protein [Actinacidiphila bryophytorum]